MPIRRCFVSGCICNCFNRFRNHIWRSSCRVSAQDVGFWSISTRLMVFMCRLWCQFLLVSTCLVSIYVGAVSTSPQRGNHGSRFTARKHFVVARASNRKIGEQKFRAFRWRFGFVLWILTIVFDIRPSDRWGICSGGFGWLVASQKNSCARFVCD